MVAILEIEAVSSMIQPISINEYHAICGMNHEAYAKTELIEGIIIKKMTKSPLHSRIFSRLCRFLFRHLGDDYWVRPELPLTLAASEPEPDISLVRGNEDDYANHHPAYAELVIEIAISSLEIDRAKAGSYAAAGIPEYWIIIPEQKKVEVYTRPEDGEYKLLSAYGKNQSIESLAGFGLALSDIF